MDGFLIVLDKDANILYVSETIAGHVGLSQVMRRFNCGGGGGDDNITIKLSII
jgi:hypothetical protein